MHAEFSADKGIWCHCAFVWRLKNCVRMLMLTRPPVRSSALLRHVVNKLQFCFAWKCARVDNAKGTTQMNTIVSALMRSMRLGQQEASTGSVMSTFGCFPVKCPNKRNIHAGQKNRSISGLYSTLIRPYISGKSKIVVNRMLCEYNIICEYIQYSHRASIAEAAEHHAYFSELKWFSNRECLVSYCVSNLFNATWIEIVISGMSSHFQSLLIDLTC